MFNYCFRYNVAYTFRIWLMPFCTLGEIEIVKMAVTNVKKIKIAIASLLILPEKRTLSLCLVICLFILCLNGKHVWKSKMAANMVTKDKETPKWPQLNYLINIEMYFSLWLSCQHLFPQLGRLALVRTLFTFSQISPKIFTL